MQKCSTLNCCKGQQRGETSEQRLCARVFLVLPVRGDLQIDDGRQREHFAERARDPGLGFPPPSKFQIVFVSWPKRKSISLFFKINSLACVSPGSFEGHHFP